MNSGSFQGLLVHWIVINLDYRSKLSLIMPSISTDLNSRDFQPIHIKIVSGLPTASPLPSYAPATPAHPPPALRRSWIRSPHWAAYYWSTSGKRSTCCARPAPPARNCSCPARLIRSWCGCILAYSIFTDLASGVEMKWERVNLQFLLTSKSFFKRNFLVIFAGCATSTEPILYHFRIF